MIIPQSVKFTKVLELPSTFCRVFPLSIRQWRIRMRPKVRSELALKIVKYSVIRMKWDFRNDALPFASPRFPSPHFTSLWSGLVHIKCGNMICQLHETEINTHFLLSLLFLFLTSPLKSQAVQAGVAAGNGIGSGVGGLLGWRDGGSGSKFVRAEAPQRCHQINRHTKANDNKLIHNT